MLIRIGLAAHMTLIETTPCGGDSPAIIGLMSLPAALARALAGSSCRFEFVDGQTVRILPAPTRPHAAGGGPAHRSPTPEVSEVLVTGPHRRTGADALSEGASIVSGAQIARLGASEAGELASVMAGVTITNLGPGRDKLLLRGVADSVFTGRVRSVVGVLLDEMPLTLSAPDPDLRLVDMERVEVARGPQAGFRGSGAIGGIYRMVPNKPDLDQAFEQATLSGAATARGSPSEAADIILNLPIHRNRSGLRLVGYDELQGGYIRNTARRHQGINQTQRTGGRLAIRSRLSDDWIVDLSVAGQRLTDADSQYVVSGWGRYRRPRSTREAHRDLLGQAALTVEGDGRWGHASGLIGWVGRQKRGVYDAAAFQSLSAPISSNRAYLEEMHARLWVGELNLASPEGRRVWWRTGVYVARSAKLLPSSLVSFKAPRPSVTSYAETRRDAVTDAAAYATASYDLGGGWTAMVGARLALTRSRDRLTATVAGRQVLREATRTDAGILPLVSLQRAVGGGSIYALYAEGLRPGGMNSVGLGRTKFAPAVFADDRLRNFELGIHAPYSRGDGELRAALFLENWKRVQSDQYTRLGGSYTANVGDARNTGLELETSYAVTPDLTLSAQGQWVQTRLLDANPIYVVNPFGGLPGVPRISAGAGFTYRRALTSGAQLTLSGDVSYQGRSYVSLETPSHWFRAPAMGDYLSDRFSVEVSRADWSVALFVDNITDSSRDTFAFGNPFSFGRIYQSTPQRPRTIGVQVSARR